MKETLKLHSPMLKTYKLPDTCEELQMLHVINESLEELTTYEKERVIVWITSRHLSNIKESI